MKGMALDAVLLISFSVLIAGIGMMHIPAAMIVGGVLGIVAAIVAGRR